MVDFNKVDPITLQTELTQDGRPTRFFIRQWNLIQRFVNAAGNSLNGLRVNTTAPLTGGGLVVDTPDIALTPSGVTPGSYTTADITVDEFGLITAAANGAGGSQWQLLATRDFAANPGTELDVTGLTGTEVLVIASGVNSVAVLSFLNVILSVDNGSTFYNTSGDYLNVQNTGLVPPNNSGIGMGSSNTTAGKTGYALISGINVNGAPKLAQTNQSDTPSSGAKLFVASLAPVNALRVNRQGQTMNAGVVYVLGR